MQVVFWVYLSLFNMIAELLKINGTKTLITGGTGGIGTVIAELFKMNNQEVYITGRDTSKLKHHEEKGYFTYHIDLTSSEEIKTNVSNMPVFDNIILCHGVACSRLFKQSSPQFIDDCLSGNFRSSIDLIANIIRKKKINSPGRIVNISSISAYTGCTTVPVYSGAKLGTDQALRSLARDLLKKDITVNSIAPAAIKTDIWGSDNYLGRKDEFAIMKGYALGVGKPEYVAKTAAFLCSRGNSYITGETILMDGGRPVII